MAVLENDPRNPCVGCGPENPLGLKLVFDRTSDGASAPFLATPHMQGWPGRLHSGLLYLALLETANWTLYASRDRVGLPTRTSALAMTRWVAIGETLTLRGRPVTTDDAATAAATIVVEAVDGKGAVVATLERAYALPDRKTFLDKMGYDEVPAGFEDVLPE